MFDHVERLMYLQRVAPGLLQAWGNTVMFLFAFAALVEQRAAIRTFRLGYDDGLFW